MDKKQDLSLCSYSIHIQTRFRCKDTHRRKVKRWKKIFHANGNQRKLILISDKIDFKTRAVIKDK